MKSLAKLMRLPRQDWWLLLRAVLWINLTRLGLRLLPLQTVCRLLVSRKRTPEISASDENRAARLIWAVEVAGRYLPDDKPCLPKALVAQRLLSRAGYVSTLQIGFRCSGDSGVTAHAWLEDQGQILVGNLPDLHDYVTISRLSRQTL